MTAAQRVDAGGANDLWHYAVGSERKGPVPRTTIAKLLASGEISAETYVWQPGMDNWVHLGDAPTLKPLVAGLEGDGHPEEFVEEDTSFTSAAEVKAAHSQLDDADEELSGDTIVESLPAQQAAAVAASASEAMGPRGTQKQPKKGKAEAKSSEAAPVSTAKAEPVKEPVAKPAPKLAAPAAKAAAAVEPAAKIGTNPVMAAAPAAAAPAKGDSGILGGVAASSAAASDMFGGAGGAEDDLFGGSAPASEGEDIAGVHGRRQSSVLFSLDELGREDGKKAGGGGGGGKGGNEQFVTDSSGLIDIKAIATNEKRSGGDDPFGASAPNLVLAPRHSPAAMSIPIVERKRGNGPWILAAAALLLVGGVIVAFIVAGGGSKDPVPTNPPVVATAEPPKTEPAAPEKKPEPAADPKVAEAGKPAGDPAAPGPGTNPATPNPEVAKVDPGTPPPAGDPAANPGANPTVKPEDKPKTETKPKVEDKPKTETKPKTEDKPKVEDKPKTEDKPKVEEPKVKVEAPVKDKEGNTAKVNDLLNKLNSGGEGDKKDTTTNDSALPDKLSAATVRNTIKGRFGRCGGMISNPTGSVTVQTQFVISSSGVVQSARVSDGGGTSPDVQRCVVGVIKETTFAKFKEPTMQVNLPVRLL